MKIESITLPDGSLVKPGNQFNETTTKGIIVHTIVSIVIFYENVYQLARVITGTDDHTLNGKKKEFTYLTLDGYNTAHKNGNEFGYRIKGRTRLVLQKTYNEKPIIRKSLSNKNISNMAILSFTENYQYIPHEKELELVSSPPRPYILIA